jgi:hypothetical protein
MTATQKEQASEKYLALCAEISKAMSEEELDEIGDAAEACMCLGRITKAQYRAIEEELDDRLMQLVEEGVV